MDYSLEIIKLISLLEDNSKYIELKNDYDCLYNMVLSRNYDIKLIYSIRDKYINEIIHISIIREKILLNNKQIPNNVDENNYIRECDFLLNMLTNIFIVRLYRDISEEALSEEFESRLVTKDLKLLFEELRLLIKNKSYS